MGKSSTVALVVSILTFGILLIHFSFATSTSSGPRPLNRRAIPLPIRSAAEDDVLLEELPPYRLCLELCRDEVLIEDVALRVFSDGPAASSQLRLTWGSADPRLGADGGGLCLSGLLPNRPALTTPPYMTAVPCCSHWS